MQTPSSSAMKWLVSCSRSLDVLLLTMHTDNDEYIVYPDTDGDEDVVYAYHAINDK
jgi:hypothetical protein